MSGNPNNSEIKRKVLFFLPNSVGGAERVTITIAKCLDINKFDVRFIVVGRSLDKILQFIPDTYCVRLLRVYNIYDFAICRLVRLMRNERPDVVFSSLHYLNVRVILSSKLVRGIKSVVRCNSVLLAKSFIFNFVAKCVYPKADAIVAQTEEMATELIDRLCVDAKKVRVLHNPIDIQYIENKLANAISPYSSSKPNIVSVVRFCEQKGLDTLIDAFAIFSSKISDAHLFFIGDHNANIKIFTSAKTQVEKDGLSQNVHFVGITQNPYDWIKYADCFVLPSRFENLPNSLLEATYLKTPVVVTASVPIIERIVENGENGYLVPVDDANAMADAMQKAINLKSKGLTLYQSATAEQFCRLFD